MMIGQTKLRIFLDNRVTWNYAYIVRINIELNGNLYFFRFKHLRIGESKTKPNLPGKNPNWT